MATTALFVELLVVGFGALTWLTALVVAVVGHKWIPIAHLDAPYALLGFLSIAYVLGIATDRVADAAFGPITAKVRRRYFGSGDEYYSAKNRVSQHSTFNELAEYGRSRLRVVRGWTMNLVLAVPVFNAVVFVRISPTPRSGQIALAGSALLIGVATLCAFAWFRLTTDSFERLADQERWLLKGNP